MALHDAGVGFALRDRAGGRDAGGSKNQKHLRARAVAMATHLYPLHLQERGRLESLLPDQQLAVQLHAEEHVLPALRLDAEAVFPLVQEVVVLEQTAQRPQVNSAEPQTHICSGFLTTLETENVNKTSHHLYNTRVCLKAPSGIKGAAGCKSIYMAGLPAFLGFLLPLFF